MHSESNCFSATEEKLKYFFKKKTISFYGNVRHE